MRDGIMQLITTDLFHVNAFVISVVAHNTVYNKSLFCVSHNPVIEVGGAATSGETLKSRTTLDDVLATIKQLEEEPEHLPKPKSVSSHFVTFDLGFAIFVDTEIMMITSCCCMSTTISCCT